MRAKFVSTFNFDNDRLMAIDIWNYTNRNPQAQRPLEYYILTIEREKKQLQRVIVSQFNDRYVLFFELAYPASIRRTEVGILHSGQPNMVSFSCCKHISFFSQPSRGSNSKLSIAGPAVWSILRKVFWQTTGSSALSTKTLLKKSSTFCSQESMQGHMCQSNSDRSM